MVRGAGVLDTSRQAQVPPASHRRDAGATPRNANRPTDGRSGLRPRRPFGVPLLFQQWRKGENVGTWRLKGTSLILPRRAEVLLSIPLRRSAVPAGPGGLKGTSLIGHSGSKRDRARSQAFVRRPKRGRSRSANFLRPAGARTCLLGPFPRVPAAGGDPPTASTRGHSPAPFRGDRLGRSFALPLPAAAPPFFREPRPL